MTVSPSAHRLVTALGYYYATSSVVLLGVIFGTGHLQVHRTPPADHARHGFVSAFANIDGVYYADIARDGYAYDPERRSNVAFFPLFPLLGRAVAWVTGLPPELALVLASNLCLMGVFFVSALYVEARSPDEPVECRSMVLVALGLWPTTFFFRMAYSESLFLLVVLLAMYGILRHWPAWQIAPLVGLATGIRPVGVALVPVFLWHLWWRPRGTKQAGVEVQAVATGRDLMSRRSWIVTSAARCACLLPLSCWGIVGYMLYQQVLFGDPLAFAKTQQHWVTRGGTPADRVQALISFEPLWSVYDPSSVAYWARHEPGKSPFFSFHFANPVYYACTAALVGLGAWRRWLNREEILLAALLLLIPYVSHSYGAIMMGHGRYAAVVFPAYLVLGRLLQSVPTPLAAALSGISSFFLGAYSAMFSAWYPTI